MFTTHAKSAQDPATSGWPEPALTPPTTVSGGVARTSCLPAPYAQRETDANTVSANAPSQFPLELDRIGCGMVMFLGGQILFTNRAAAQALQLQPGTARGATRSPASRSLQDLGAILRSTLKHAQHACIHQVVELQGHRRDLAAAIVPLTRGHTAESDLTLVILGNRRMCEDLSLRAGDFLGQMEELLMCPEPAQELNRELLTILFTDIVESTRCATQMGDAHWCRVLQRHYAIVRRHIQTFCGREIDTAGDGFLMTFDSPARAVRCALAIANAMRVIGIEIRAGLHTGECEVVGGKVVGVAVHVANRIAATAMPGEILVSNTVRELVNGSQLHFSKGTWHVLKGLDTKWRLFALRDLTGQPQVPRELALQRTLEQKPASREPSAARQIPRRMENRYTPTA